MQGLVDLENELPVNQNAEFVMERWARGLLSLELTLAEGVRFELTVPLPARRISSPVHSTTLPTFLTKRAKTLKHHGRATMLAPQQGRPGARDAPGLKLRPVLLV